MYDVAWNAHAVCDQGCTPEERYIALFVVFTFLTFELGELGRNLAPFQM